jgi:hypothetical protein
VKDDNPFREWLERDVYGGYWVPIGQLGGWLGPVACPSLVRTESDDAVLADGDWPLQFGSAQPEVWETFSGDARSRNAVLHPSKQTENSQFLPFVAHFDPFGKPSWLEPVQSFVLYWQAWPRHDSNGTITWFEERDDSRPSALARWIVRDFRDGVTTGVLEVRRDRLMTFLGSFSYDLAIYYEDSTSAPALLHGWSDEGRDQSRSWRAWATLVHPDVRAVVRAVTLIKRPPYEDLVEVSDRRSLKFVIGSDQHGQPVSGSCPPDEFLTPVFFRNEVLERYYQDPSTFTVEEDLVRGGRQWLLSIAPTGRGTIQAWLGDINQLPESVQQHWQAYAVPDEGVPEWRLRRDLLGQFTESIDEGPIADLRRSLSKANASAVARYGELLFSVTDDVHAESVRTLRVPANESTTSFLEQVRTLAILVVDHLNSRFLDAAGVPPDSEGTLKRAALLLGMNEGQELSRAKERLRGLYAVQSVRSNVAAHRTGPKADQTLARAGISRMDLPAGFVRLVEGATESIDNLRAVINGLSEEAL